jgi:uncharacterized SAM-binding protein YcdF (DUF218 family)
MRRPVRRALWGGLRCAAAALAVGLLGFAAGLVWFTVPLPAETDAGPTDAIVVLTGGSMRLQSGLDLLREGKGKKLFVSGVNREVGLEELLRVAGNAPAWAACCVALGHDADNTWGNARETARWMRRNGYRSLRLVTAWYHMRRGLLEFERAMPQVAIIPHPVFPDTVRQQHWWARTGTAQLLLGEYVKYLGALFRPLLARLKPDFDEPRVEAEMRR